MPDTATPPDALDRAFESFGGFAATTQTVLRREYYRVADQLSVLAASNALQDEQLLSLEGHIRLHEESIGLLTALRALTPANPEGERALQKRLEEFANEVEQVMSEAWKTIEQERDFPPPIESTTVITEPEPAVSRLSDPDAMVPYWRAVIAEHIHGTRGISQRQASMEATVPQDVISKIVRGGMRRASSKYWAPLLRWVQDTGGDIPDGLIMPWDLYRPADG